MASYLERPTLAVPPIRLKKTLKLYTRGNPQCIEKLHYINQPNQHLDRKYVWDICVLFSPSRLSVGTPDMPCMVSHTTSVVIIWTEGQSITSWEISRSCEVWVWTPVVFKFPAQLSASHSLCCSSLFKKLFYSALEMGLLDTVYYLHELRRCLVFTDGTGLYCARHWRLLMIFLSLLSLDGFSL